MIETRHKLLLLSQNNHFFSINLIKWSRRILPNHEAGIYLNLFQDPNLGTCSLSTVQRILHLQDLNHKCWKVILFSQLYLLLSFIPLFFDKSKMHPGKSLLNKSRFIHQSFMQSCPLCLCFENKNIYCKMKKVE